MDRRLQEHITDLEQELQVITAHLMNEAPGRLKGRRDLETRLRAVELMLAFYRSACEIQERLSSTAKDFC